MKLLFSLLFIVASMSIKAQTGNMVFFSEDGDKFILYVNGIQKNTDFQTNVRCDGLKENVIKARIVFEDKNLPEIIKTFGFQYFQEVTVNIKRNKKGEIVARVASVINLPGYVAPSGPAPVVGAPINTPPPVTSTPGGPLTATVSSDAISLSDGRSFSISKSEVFMAAPEIEMKSPVGAKVTISYEGKVAYTSEVPFHYTVEDYNNYNVYCKMEVEETNGAKWSCKIQHGTKYKLTIE